MSVISVNHLSLVRTRKALEVAFEKQQWDEVREWDTLLGECLNKAFDDEQRDTAALVLELERVLKLYADIVASLPDQAAELSLQGATGLGITPRQE